MAQLEDAAPQGETAAPRSSRRLLLLAPILMAAGAAGGFGIVRSGLLALPGADPPDQEAPPGVLPDVAYVPLDPMVVNLGGAGSGRFLRFHAQVEVPVARKAEVAVLVPRIVDVLNSYLRAVDVAVLEDRSALIRLKSQMLRRIQLVAGGGRVRDLLVMEFVVS